MVGVQELERLGIIVGIDGYAMRQGGAVFVAEAEMVCSDVVVCSRGVVCGRGIGGMQRFCYQKRHWWHAVMLLLFGAAETEVACGSFVLVCS
jgi:hypothetical protein